MNNMDITLLFSQLRVELENMKDMKQHIEDKAEAWEHTNEFEGYPEGLREGSDHIAGFIEGLACIIEQHERDYIASLPPAQPSEGQLPLDL